MAKGKKLVALAAKDESPSTAQRVTLIVERVTRKMGRGAQINYSPICATVAEELDAVLERNRQFFKSGNTDKITREVISMSVPLYLTVAEWDADVAERKHREEESERLQTIRQLSARQRAILGLTLPEDDAEVEPPTEGNDNGESTDNGDGQQSTEPTEPVLANA